MPTQFHVSEESLGHHYSVVTADDQGGKHQFYVENAPGASKKPDLTFYDGADNTGSLIGLSKFPRITNNCEVRLVDEQSNEDWVPVTKRGFMSMKYTFEIPAGCKQGALTWKKTRSMGSGSSPYGNMKLIDEKSHNVLAVFSSDSFSLVTGRLDMCQDQGGSFDRWALITGMAVREKQRRHTIGTVRSKENVYTMGAAGGGMGMGAMGGMGGGGGC
ncbi:uncharacterized protein N7443_002486 [Penicillium atrosanguineum]|uniref:uncharacterized protein n=1 Tax=Penicillium atrosanguineum TaxID=1132637 RepID=UPI0023A03992|nr:uncharacterized protein N7443_002486 [Penicillium atrosanguineum]KAJ5310025.1 hypothetical protein N7443_002486 [Penicillium atrosanguineum]